MNRAVCFGCIPIKLGLQIASVAEVLAAMAFFTWAWNIAFIYKGAAYLAFVLAAFVIAFATFHALWLAKDCYRTRYYMLRWKRSRIVISFGVLIINLYRIFTVYEDELPYHVHMGIIYLNLLIYDLYLYRTIQRYRNLQGDR